MAALLLDTNAEIEILLVKALDKIDRDERYISDLRKFKSTFKELVQKMREIQQNNEMLGLPNDEGTEIRKLKGILEVTEKLLLKYSQIPWWNFYLTRYYRSKLDAAHEKIVRFISVEMQARTARNLKEILITLKSYRHQMISAEESDYNRSRATLMGDEILPEFTEGLDDPDPLNELKFDLNLSNLVGSGNVFSRTSSSSSYYTASLSQSLKKYDVFISFRGEDIRGSFKGHLHDALCRKKIEAYVDDRLDIGDELWPALAKAIKDSVLFLVIFSENYASSSWCLKELAHILECTKNRTNRVMPVFYNIDPSHVRKQTGSYQMALAEHERNHPKKQVDDWRHALTRTANLKGWDSRNYSNDEVELIRQIVTRIVKKLDTMFQSVYSDSLFGIDDQIAHVEALLCNESQDVRFVGIWGIPGIGKTTIAVQLFNNLLPEFEGYCFLEKIREISEKYGMQSLKDKLLSSLLEDETPHMSMLGAVQRRLARKKVLIVLDDVNDPHQLMNLVGTPTLFGKGSRVIIIARDKQVFGKIVDDTYEVKPLGFDDALGLFKSHAFKDDCSVMEFEQLSRKVADYAKGIPSTLMVLGSFLFGKSMKEWEEQLEKITRIPVTKIQQILKLSHDGVVDEDKNIILDIASTFKDRKAEHIKNLLDTFGYSTIEGLGKVLQLRAEGENGE